MRAVADNKMTGRTTERCPTCGRSGTACRAVPLGWWCATNGLKEDTSTWIIPTPDPIHEAVKADPQVLAARLEQNIAEQAFDKATETWMSALGDLAGAHLEGRNTMLLSGGIGRRRAQKNEQELVEAEEQAREERERLGEELTRRRVAYQKAVRKARRRITEG